MHKSHGSEGKARPVFAQTLLVAGVSGELAEYWGKLFKLFPKYQQLSGDCPFFCIYYRSENYHRPETEDTQWRLSQPNPPLSPLPTSDRYGRGLPNLTDIADRFGSDKGSSRHRYKELYNMLFQPCRERAINFIEMGLLIGGPEQAESADRETRDLPSIRMWLEYFSKAKIIGLDISDFSWFKDKRFTFHRCDMDNRDEIAAAGAKMPVLHIVIDDASHASHHQQNAFLALFPKLKSGGFYIIEDLLWQPDTFEKADFTKTAPLFQSYLSTGVFSHSDGSVAQIPSGIHVVNPA